MEKPFAVKPEEFEAMAKKWKDAGKPSKIVASFSNILELEGKHLKHFKNAPYVWKHMNGNSWAGMLMDDNMEFIQLVLATEDVVQYILKL